MMKDIVLILVAGKSNTGKGEFSRRLEEVYKTKTNHNIIRCSLSTYIRE
jgi:uridine kinase